jgi:HK97 family phage prohead protease
MVWSHKWDMPIGKGSIKKDKDKAYFDGSFFMDTESGKEAYNLVKNMGDLQQWSFGFKVNDSEYGKWKKSAEEEVDVRYLKNLSVYEVSPVLVGANQDTFTMAIKSGENSEVKVMQEDEEISDEEKAKLGKDIFDNPGEAMNRAKELSCADGVHTQEMDGQTVFMPCNTHAEYEEAMKGDKGHTPQHTSMQALGQIAEDMKEILASMPKDENADLPSWWVDKLTTAAKEINEIRDLLIDPQPKSEDQENVSEKSASVQGKRFSDEVKDVLAALNNLVARVQSIGELRKKNGRKLGVSATEALRQVQESVQDAFSELDKFVDEFGTEGALETEAQVVEETVVEEPTAEEEIEETEAVTEEVVNEETPEEPEEDTEEENEIETEEEVPVDEVSETTEEEVDNELDDLWLESQQIVTEAILTDIEIEEENE